MTIEPSPGVVLVSLAASKFGNIPVPTKAHDSQTWGLVVALNKTDSVDHGHLLNRVAYWREFKDDARVPGQDKLALIEIKDILGTSYEPDSTD